MFSELHIVDLKVQELANTAWALASAGTKHSSLFTALAIAAGQRMIEFQCAELQQLSMGICSGRTKDYSQFAALPTTAE